MMPRSRSSTRTRLPTSTNIFEPPFCQAFSLTGNVSSICSVPAFKRSSTINTVIILLMEAGAVGTSADFSISTVSLEISIK